MRSSLLRRSCFVLVSSCLSLLSATVSAVPPAGGGAAGSVVRLNSSTFARLLGLDLRIGSPNTLVTEAAVAARLSAWRANGLVTSVGSGTVATPAELDEFLGTLRRDGQPINLSNTQQLSSAAFELLRTHWGTLIGSQVTLPECVSATTSFALNRPQLVATMDTLKTSIDEAIARRQRNINDAANLSPTSVYIDLLAESEARLIRYQDRLAVLEYFYQTTGNSVSLVDGTLARDLVNFIASGQISRSEGSIAVAMQPTARLLQTLRESVMSNRLRDTTNGWPRTFQLAMMRRAQGALMSMEELQTFFRDCLQLGWIPGLSVSVP